MGNSTQSGGRGVCATVGERWGQAPVRERSARRRGGLGAAVHSQVPKKDAATDDALSALGSGVAVFMRAQAVLSVVDKVRSAVDELVHAAMHEQELMARALRAPTGYAFNGTAVRCNCGDFATRTN